MPQIADHRLFSQQLSYRRFHDPAELVSCFGAIQAQEYPSAKWAVGQRLQNARDSDIEQAFTAGALLRVHIMRPTWHFVTPQDIGWIMDLTRDRVIAGSAYYWRQAELDETVFARSSAVLARALQGGKQLTRAEIRPILEQAGISGSSLRLTHILHRAELDKVICSGARRGKQFTYVFFDDRVPQTQALTRDEALAELTRRYFTCHGPATLQDFAWWSGLTVADAKAGVEMAGSRLEQEEVEGKTYWFGEPMTAQEANLPTAVNPSPSVYLLPSYDELTVGYADRSALYNENPLPQMADPFLHLGHVIVIDGQISGTWKREFKKDAVVLSISPLRPLTKAEEQALNAAVQRYAEFWGLPARIGV